MMLVWNGNSSLEGLFRASLLLLRYAFPHLQFNVCLSMLTAQNSNNGIPSKDNVKFVSIIISIINIFYFLPMRGR